MYLLAILLLFLITVTFVTWHLWCLTPGGWVPKLAVSLLFLLWMVAAFASMALRSRASLSTITALFEKSWGHYQRGNTRYYISSGLGIWGPKIRVGTRSEYLVLHLVSGNPETLHVPEDDMVDNNETLRRQHHYPCELPHQPDQEIIW